MKHILTLHTRTVQYSANDVPIHETIWFTDNRLAVLQYARGPIG